MIGQRSAKLGADAPKLRSHQVMNQDTDQRLRAYVLAAGAAGVGLLAAAQPAKAQVVYAPSNTTISDGALFILAIDNFSTSSGQENFGTEFVNQKNT